MNGSTVNPLVGLYATADDRYISFVMMQPTKFWADVCRHIDLGTRRRPTVRDRRAHRRQHCRSGGDPHRGDGDPPLAEWSERFATLAGPWAPVQDTLQAAQDAQVRANEYLVQAGELELVANPVQFDVSAPHTGRAPGFAEQTDEILGELGLDWDRIIELKTAGAVT